MPTTVYVAFLGIKLFIALWKDLLSRYLALQSVGICCVLASLRSGLPFGGALVVAVRFCDHAKGQATGVAGYQGAGVLRGVGIMLGLCSL